MPQMTHDWLLVETLGTEPVVVAQGRRTKNLVPISAFLRRSPNLMAIQTAIGETVRSGQTLSTITPRNDRVIRTEAVQMSDGRMHGVHVWIGPPGEEPPDRPIPGPLKWDLTKGVATDTTESLLNSGWDPSKEATHGRAFAEDLPVRDLHPSETKVLMMVIKGEPGKTLCTTWDLTDYRGETITVGFVTRAILEPQDDGSDRLICRSMNWRSEREGAAVPPDNLAQRILNGLAQPGVHRALVDPRNWTLLKWLDEPAPFFDWRLNEAGEPPVNPADASQLARMTEELASGSTAGVLYMRAIGGGWTPVHLTVNRVELEENTFMALVSMRVPTEAELAAAELGTTRGDAEPSPPKVTRKARARHTDKAAKS
jgi:hypothetical protein